MRQRGMGWVGAIAAMVVAGLIVYGIIYYGPSIWQGIQESQESSGVQEKSMIRQINENPQEYANRIVTVEGTYVSILVLADDEGYTITIVGNTLLELSIGENYKVTGRVLYNPIAYTSGFVLDGMDVELI